MARCELRTGELNAMSRFTRSDGHIRDGESRWRCAGKVGNPRHQGKLTGGRLRDIFHTSDWIIHGGAGDRDLQGPKAQSSREGVATPEGLLYYITN